MPPVIRHAAALGITLMLSAAPVAGVVQTKQQQKCINSMTKGMDLILKLQARVGSKCVSDYLTGKIISANTLCDSFEYVPRFNKINQRLIAWHQKRCPPPAPGFGPGQPADVIGPTTNTVNNTARDTFGITLDPGLVKCGVDAAKCDCQQRVFRQMTQLVRRMSTAFRRCAKAALKGKKPFSAPASALTDVQQCLTNPLLSTSVLGDHRVTTAIQRFNQLFQPPPPNSPIRQCPVGNEFGIGPGSMCGNLAGQPLADCLLANVKCHVCRAIQGTYDFNLLCNTWSGFLICT
jgi:hypothetical protein